MLSWGDANGDAGDFFPPIYNCPHELDRLGALGDGGKWMCGMSRIQDKPDCVIYSFGASPLSPSTPPSSLLLSVPSPFFPVSFLRAHSPSLLLPHPPLPCPRTARASRPRCCPRSTPEALSPLPLFRPIPTGCCRSNALAVRSHFSSSHVRSPRRRPCLL